MSDIETPGEEKYKPGALIDVWIETSKDAVKWHRMKIGEVPEKYVKHLCMMEPKEQKGQP
jgi:hypothetical protein